MWCTTYQKFWWAILCIFRWLFFTNFTTRVNKKSKLINCILNPCFQNIAPWVPVFCFFLSFFSAIECSSESFRVTCWPMQPESVHENSLTPSVQIWQKFNDQKKKKKLTTKQIIRTNGLRLLILIVHLYSYFRYFLCWPVAQFAWAWKKITPTIRKL